jgi:hypothetical protein
MQCATKIVHNYGRWLPPPTKYGFKHMIARLCLLDDVAPNHHPMGAMKCHVPAGRLSPNHHGQTVAAICPGILAGMVTGHSHGCRDVRV